MRADHVLTAWPLLARLHGAISLRVPSLPGDAAAQLAHARATVEQAAEGGTEAEPPQVEHPLLAKLVGIAAAYDDCHVDDWLRYQALDHSIPRRKAPLSSDVVLRLRGLRAVRLAMSLKLGAHPAEDLARVTIVNAAGDAASAIGPDLTYTLNAAMKMVGASEA